MARLEPKEKELERLRREHMRLDEKVSALDAQRWLSEKEESEVRRLKRLKLEKKDRMKALGAAL